jgi:hypothetical protein
VRTILLPLLRSRVRDVSSRSLVFLRATAAFSCATTIRDSNSANSMSAPSWVSLRGSVIDGDDKASASRRRSVMLLSAERDVIGCSRSARRCPGSGGCDQN